MRGSIEEYITDWKKMDDKIENYFLKIDEYVKDW